MTHRMKMLFAIALLGSSLGCPGDEATPPTAEGDTGDGDSGDGDGDPGDGDGDPGDGDGDGDDCLGPNDCFDCEPTHSVELTNACTDATCEAFDNSPARLPLLERDGSLPPLP